MTTFGVGTRARLPFRVFLAGRVDMGGWCSTSRTAGQHDLAWSTTLSGSTADSWRHGASGRPGAVEFDRSRGPGHGVTSNWKSSARKRHGHVPQAEARVPQHTGCARSRGVARPIHGLRCRRRPFRTVGPDRMRRSALGAAERVQPPRSACVSGCSRWRRRRGACRRLAAGQPGGSAVAGLTPNRPPIRDGWRCGPVASRGLCVRRRRDHGQVPVAWVLFKGRREGAR